MIPGVAMKGEYYTFTDEELPCYSGIERVYGVGNVVTGQGNIRVSLVHSQKVTAHLIRTLHRWWAPRMAGASPEPTRRQWKPAQPVQPGESC